MLKSVPTFTFYALFLLLAARRQPMVDILSGAIARAAPCVASLLLSPRAIIRLIMSFKNSIIIANIAKR